MGTNQKPLVVKTRMKTPDELKVHKSTECNFSFHFSAPTLLVGRQVGHLVCIKLRVGIFVVTICLGLCMSCTPAVTITSINLSPIKSRMVTLLAYLHRPRKINKCCCCYCNYYHIGHHSEALQPATAYMMYRAQLQFNLAMSNSVDTNTSPLKSFVGSGGMPQPQHWLYGYIEHS